VVTTVVKPAQSPTHTSRLPATKNLGSHGRQEITRVQIEKRAHRAAAASGEPVTHHNHKHGSIRGLA
jgi:hypothetical protein